MNYSKIYNSLISSRKNRNVVEGEYYEMHHIVPRSIGGSDLDSNLVMLTGREHFLAHWLLSKIHNNYKLASAFNKMCSVGVGQSRINSHLYHIARKHFSKHHPCKDSRIRNKISESLIRRNKVMKEQGLTKRVCQISWCKGCGILIKTNRRKCCSDKCRNELRNTPEHRKRLSEIHKNRLSKLTPEERSERMRKSALSGINEETGKMISESKKKERAKIQSMDEDEFYKALSKCKMYKKGGGRNGNYVRLLKYRGIDVDTYYANRRI